MDKAYDDKLDGKISEDYWERKSREWRQAQVRVRASMEKHEHANQSYFDAGSRILDLAAKAYDLWLQQDSFGKRQLLNTVIPNCTFDGESLRAAYAKPFCWIAEGHGRSDWLPGREAIRMVNIRAGSPEGGELVGSPLKWPVTTSKCGKAVTSVTTGPSTGLGAVQPPAFRWAY